MALKCHINNATQNQAGQMTTLQTAVLTEGVYSKDRGDFAGAGTAGLAVNIAKGEAFVQNDDYVYGTMDQKFFNVASTATESVTITANASGNPRIDLIAIKVDDAVTPGILGVDAVSLIAIAGTPAASPSAPATPDNHLPLYQVAVANGASVISTSDLTDVRPQFTVRATNIDDWKGYTDIVPTRTVNGDPIFTIRFAAVNLTDRLSAGMRVTWVQNSTQRFGLIHKVSLSSSNTDVVVYGGTDYNVDDTSTYPITEFKYSGIKAPYGFPLDPAKWTVEAIYTTDVTVSSPSSGSYNNLSMTVSLGIGVWNTHYAVQIDATRASQLVAVAAATLSTTTSTQTDPDFTTFMGNANATDYATRAIGRLISVVKPITVASTTTYYLLAYASGGGYSSIVADNDTLRGYIRAVSAYL